MKDRAIKQFEQFSQGPDFIINAVPFIIIFVVFFFCFK